MDGGGRLARSPRSPRQQTDLMDAVIGAAAALRPRLRPVSPPAKSRRLNRDEAPPRLIAFMERRLPRRSGVIATLLLLTASTSLGIVKGGHLDAFIATL